MSRLALLAARARINHAAAAAWALWANTSPAGVLSAGNTLMTTGTDGTWGMAAVDVSAAMVQKTYAEISITPPGLYSNNNAGGVIGWDTSGGLADDFVGQRFGGADIGADIRRSNAGGAGTLYIYHGGGSIITAPIAGVHGDGNYHVGIALDPATRDAWLCLVGHNPVPWVGGGDPATGKIPTATLTDTGPLLLAGSASQAGLMLGIKAPDAYLGTPPSGFTAGIPA